MALFDAHNRFSDKQNISATAVSTNVIDMGVDRDVAVATQLDVVVQAVDVSGDVAGTGKVTVAIQTSDTAAFSTVTTLATSPALTAADFNAGPWAVKLPYGGKRYLRLKYTVDGTVTGLAVTAGLVLATSHPEDYVHAMHN